MKSTGIVRKVDELGRVVLPIELRRTLDIAEKDALEMVQEIKGYKVLKGFRGRPAGDLKALVEIILKCSKMMAENKIQEFDINPLFVQPDGALAVDFRMSK